MKTSIAEEWAFSSAHLIYSSNIACKATWGIYLVLVHINNFLKKILMKLGKNIGRGNK